jgi:hypothetical protein
MGPQVSFQCLEESASGPSARKINPVPNVTSYMFKDKLCFILTTETHVPQKWVFHSRFRNRVYVYDLPYSLFALLCLTLDLNYSNNLW